jgi:hypothetical protein
MNRIYLMPGDVADTNNCDFHAAPFHNGLLSGRFAENRHPTAQSWIVRPEFIHLV